MPKFKYFKRYYACETFESKIGKGGKKTMKQQYEPLILELISMDADDVILTSEGEVGWDDNWNIFT